MSDDRPAGEAVVSVEEVRRELQRAAEHMRKEAASDEWKDDPGQFLAVAEAYEDLLLFIDHGPTEAQKSAFRAQVKRLKGLHGGRHH